MIGASGEDVAFFARMKADLVRSHLTGSPRRILDFGCGIGNTTAALAAVFPEAAITGSDISARSIAHAASKHAEPGHVEFCAFEGDLPFPDASIDVAFTSCVFHHIERTAQLRWAKELRRVVAPGGALFVFEHNPYNPLTRRVVRDCVFDKGVTLLTSRYTRTLFGRAGFAVDPARFYFFFPHALAWLRPLESILGWCPIGAQYFVIAR